MALSSPPSLLSLPSSKTMVQLLLSSPKGNQGLRYFPYSGYLGLTPVRVEGVVRTKLDADLKTLPAKSISISVRCYETRVGRVNALQTNVLVDYTQVLWQKPDNVDHEHIGNLDFPFRISLPAKVAGFSTAIFVDYRCTWRVEAVLTHAPISGVGSRQIRHFELPLIRYDIPSWLPSLPPPAPLLSQQTNKPRVPRIRYSINPPRSSIGPLDLVSIPLHLQPIDQGVSIRSASVIVERRIYLHECSPSGASSSSLSAPPSATLQSSSSTSSSRPSSSHGQQPSPTHSDASYSPTQAHQPASSTLSLNSSHPTITPGTFSSASLALETTPLLPSSSNSPTSPPGTSGTSNTKVVTNPIAGAESSGTFARDANGVWSKTLTLQWPVAKSHSRWAIGETIISDLVSVRFFVRAKIIVTTPAGTETLELADQELLVVSTNETERQLATAKYNEAHDMALIDGNVRSKSKSPRRSRPPGAGGKSEGEIPPSPAVARSSGVGGGGDVRAPSSSGRSKSSSRRPHTSAGPRDKPVSFAGGAYGRPRGAEGEAAPEQAPAGSSSSAGAVASTTTAAAKRRSDFVVMRPPVLPASAGSQRPDSSHSRSEKEREKERKSKSSHASSSSRSSATASLVSGPGGPGTGKLSSSSFWSTVHSNPPASSSSRLTHIPGGGRSKMRAVPSGSSTSATTSSGSVSTQSSGRSRSGADADAEGEETEPSDYMREWEEELARIEIRSRRSSDAVGFAGKRKRSVVAGVPGAPPASMQMTARVAEAS